MKHDSFGRVLSKFPDFRQKSQMLKIQLFRISFIYEFFTYFMLNIGRNGHDPFTYMQANKFLELIDL